MPRKKVESEKKKPNARQAARNVASGKYPTKKAALMAAGYAESSAEKAAAAILNRPLVKSELTRALERAGVTFANIVKPIADGLQATKQYVHPRLGLMTTTAPDHDIRLKSVDRAIELYGGVPKVGEALPASTGLNLFVSVQTNQQPAQAQPVPVDVNVKPMGQGGKPVAPMPPRPAPMSPGISIGVSIVEGGGVNRQAMRPPSNGNGHGNGHSNGHGQKNGNGHGSQP